MKKVVSGICSRNSTLSSTVVTDCLSREETCTTTCCINFIILCYFCTHHSEAIIKKGRDKTMMRENLLWVEYISTRLSAINQSKVFLFIFFHHHYNNQCHFSKNPQDYRCANAFILSYIFDVVIHLIRERYLLML